jgi:hypothetical protein
MDGTPANAGNEYQPGVRFHDLDELNHAINGSNLEFVQLKSGNIDITLKQISLGDLTPDVLALAFFQMVLTPPGTAIQSMQRNCCSSPPRLRLLRLHQVRRHLKASGGLTTITNEAFRMGFNHMSLFTTQYKNAFGECPSVTLARATK